MKKLEILEMSNRFIERKKNRWDWTQWKGELVNKKLLIEEFTQNTAQIHTG